MATPLRLLGRCGIVIVVGRYRVRLRAKVGGLAPEALSDWSFGTLDALLDDPEVVAADVAATLAAGDVEFDLQVAADDVPSAVRLSAEALGRATGRVPAIEHAEVDLLPASA